jgi:hypothetical protein
MSGEPGCCTGWLTLPVNSIPVGGQEWFELNYRETSMDLRLPDLWTAGGVLLGFQVTAFGWRISQEAQVADRGDISWIPPADYLNLLSMVITALSVFVMPALRMISLDSSTRLLGFAALLFVGHPFALAGHYELFNPRTKRSYDYFPRQEAVAIIMVAIILAVYAILAFA